MSRMNGQGQGSVVIREKWVGNKCQMPWELLPPVKGFEHHPNTKQKKNSYGGVIWIALQVGDG